MIQTALQRLLDGHDLTRDETREVMGGIMRGEATPAQIGGFLIALRVKGETADEIAGCAEAMREHVLPVRPRREDLVDTAGTGGDGARTINISTAAALVAAAAGAAVAKHGNRAVSSASGSADVLEALGFSRGSARGARSSCTAREVSTNVRPPAPISSARSSTATCVSESSIPKRSSAFRMPRSRNCEVARRTRTRRQFATCSRERTEADAAPSS